MIDWQISWLLLNYGYVKKSYGIINVYRILAIITRGLKCFLEFQMRVKTKEG